MPVVIELTLRTLPGHYDRALAAYTEFVQELESEFEDLAIVVVAGDPATNLIRGIGAYDHSTVAEGLTSTPYFARLVERLEPHLAASPERIELELLDVFTRDGEVTATTSGDAAVVEFTMQAKLGHVDELISLHETFAAGFQQQLPDARLVMETAQRASGRIRTFILFEHEAAATEAGRKPQSADFVDSVAEILSAPPERTQLHIIHAFARSVHR